MHTHEISLAREIQLVEHLSAFRNDVLESGFNLNLRLIRMSLAARFPLSFCSHSSKMLFDMALRNRDKRTLLPSARFNIDATFVSKSLT